MKLKPRTIKEIAEMICGQDYGQIHFPYRSSSKLTDFFTNCNLSEVHDGSTRVYWVRGILDKLNEGPATNSQLPPDNLVVVIKELLEPTELIEGDPDRTGALADINKSLIREGLEAYRGGSKSVHLRNLASQISSAGTILNKRILSEQEIKKRKKLDEFLSLKDEDEVTSEILIPIFRQLGFIRITPSGHEDKALEYGKDVWMKYQLPTSHHLYFGIQVKKGKIDSAGKSKNNIGEILNQITMMLGHPIWDPETNKKNLLDHIFIVSLNTITKQAKNFLGGKLDADSRRQIIFMDKSDILELATSINFSHPYLEEPKIEYPEQINLDDIPF